MLEYLRCGYNHLKELNISKNTLLKEVYCNNNELEILNLNHNAELTLVYCESNKLKELDISNNKNLVTLWCNNNNLTSLDISQNTQLTNFYCGDNQLEISLSENRTFDLNTLPGTFDINKVSDVVNATIKNGVLTFIDYDGIDRCYYTYDIGQGESVRFTLIIKGNIVEPSEPDYSVDSSTQHPSTPSTQTPAPQTPATPSAPSAPAATEKISANTTVTDAKSNSIYKVAGNATSGYTVTYVRPTSKKAKSVTIPATVTVNGVSCKVTSIANNAFKGQKKLKKVTIGANVTTIGKKAFSGCKNLTKIVVKSKKLKKVGAKAFAKINPKAKIKVPKNKKKAYKKVFKKNTGVKASMW